MSGHAELRLITEVIRQKDFRTVVRANISDDMFMVAEAREMFRFIRDYFYDQRHYGSVPSQRIMRKSFKGFTPVTGQSSIQELCEEIREIALQNKIVQICEGIVLNLEQGESAYQSMSSLRSGYATLQTMTPASRDLILADSAIEVLEEYRLVKENGLMTGLPFPWYQLNMETQGIQEEDLVVIFGRPKSMKSWLTTKGVTHTYLHANARVMVYSCEMPPKQYRRRVACCICDLDYNRLKKGKLEPHEEELLKHELSAIAELESEDMRNGRHRSFLFTSDKDDPQGGGVSHLIAKAETFEPDIIWVDSYYRMKDDRSRKRSPKWDAQTGIIQDLKHATQQLRVPIIAVTQKKRGNKDGDTDVLEDLEDIAYADAVGMEADLVFRIVKGRKLNQDGTVPLTVQIAGAREILAQGFALSVIPCTHWRWDGWLTHDKSHVPQNGAQPRGPSVETMCGITRQAKTANDFTKKLKLDY